MREHDGAEHDLFRKLLGFGFDHHHGIAGGGDDQVEIACLHLLVGRIEDIFALDIADAGGADRAHEGHARNGERGRRGDHRQDVGLVLAVIAQHLGDDVDLVVEALGEEGADRAVDETRDQGLLLGRAALALEEAAGDAAGRAIFFLIVDGEREEILPFLDRTGGGDRAEHDRLAQSGDHGAVRLAGDAARFERQRLAAPLDFRLLDIEHLFSFTRGPDAGGTFVRASRLAAVRDFACPSWTSRPDCRTAPLMVL